MSTSGLKASSLRTIMILAALLLIGLSGVGFYFVQSVLTKFSTEVHNISPVTVTNVSAAASSKAIKAIASSQNYQKQITDDLNKYASGVGLSIVGIDFAAPSALPTGTTVNGLEAKYAKVTLANPVKFTSLMKFIKATENNLPVMRLSSLNISRVQASSDTVMVEPINLIEYAR